MPKYEIGYILSSGVSDEDAPRVIAEVSEAITAAGGNVLKEDLWGRKKLAYPIGRTRNGFYVFVTADLPAEKVRDIEHKLNTNDAIIRFLVANVTDAEKRIAKQQMFAEEMRTERPQVRASDEKDGKGVAADVDIEQEIDKAISSEEENV